MNFVGRRDSILLAGLALALLILLLFAGTGPVERPLRMLFDLARQVEQESALALVPALLVLIIVVLIYVRGKRHEARTRAAAAAAEAVAQGEAHSADQGECLITFGRALGRALDAETIREVVVRHLPTLAGTDDAWLMTRVDGGWQALAGAARAAHADAQRACETTADRTPGDGGPIDADPITVEGHLCLPLTAGGSVVGVLGVPQSAGPFGEGRLLVLTAAAALLAISIRNVQLLAALRESSQRDGLTGCFNRTHALKIIDTELRRARRSQMPVSLIMFDLDRFRDINDRHGHLCGDAVLTAVGAHMREVLRGSDVKCRYGGEEFLILLPETSVEGAKRVADALRRKLAEMSLHWKANVVRITASFGVTMAQPSEIDTQALIGRADAALFRAKDQGGNCVRLSIEIAVA